VDTMLSTSSQRSSWPKTKWGRANGSTILQTHADSSERKFEWLDNLQCDVLPVPGKVA
jgi:hypothetical protein